MKWRFVWRIFRFLILFFFITSFLAVIWYRFFPVHVTPLMFERYFEQLVSDKPVVWKHTWVSFDKISHHMPMAVIASEDNRFPYHNGFDVQQIQKAVEERIEKKRIRGASTISQQTAKNVFLWPASNFIRKGFEAYFTFLIESFWSKKESWRSILILLKWDEEYMVYKRLLNINLEQLRKISPKVSVLL
jgi:monofunctional biosynthetic peptidoglycan transglycosylase